MPRQVPKFFPKQTFANLTASVCPIVQFLTNNHPTIPGPGYQIVEAYDGTTREIPSDPLDLNSFTAGFGWRVDVASVPTTAWIVLESVRAEGNQFQVYFELDNTSTLHVLLITDGNWATGAGTDTNPTIPDRCLGSSTSAFATTVSGSVDMSGFTAAADYTVVADLSVIVFMFDAGGNSVNWIYIGEVDQSRADDPRPYVLWQPDGDVRIQNSFTQLACVDGLTGEFSIAGIMYLSCERATSDVIYLDDPSTNFLGTRKMMPVGVHQNNGPLAGTKGWLRHVWVGENNAGQGPVSLDGRSFLGRNDLDGSQGQVVLAWDRETP